MAIELKPIKSAKLPVSFNALKQASMEEKSPITEKLYNKLKSSKYDLYRRNGLPVTFGIFEEEYSLIPITLEACQEIGIVYYDPDMSVKEEIISTAGYTLINDGKWFALLPGELTKGDENYIGPNQSKDELISELYPNVEQSILDHVSESLPVWANKTEDRKLQDARMLMESILSMNMAQEIFVVGRENELILPYEDESSPKIKLQSKEGVPNYLSDSETCLNHVVEIFKSGGSIEDIDIDFIEKTLSLLKSIEKTSKKKEIRF